jgi:DNA-binding MarR family transcriptional regulator
MTLRQASICREVNAICEDQSVEPFDDTDIWPRVTGPRRSDPPIWQSVHGAYHALTRRLQDVTREHGFEASEALVLVCLLRDPGCPPAVVRSRLGFHRSTLSSLLGRLEKDGLIRRSPVGFDGRRLQVDLTPAGTTAARIAASVVGDAEAELHDFTSAADRRGAEAVFAACMAITRPDGELDI